MAYGRQLQALLDRGVVPADLATHAPRVSDPLLVQVVRGYVKGAPVAPSDEALLGTMLEELAGVRVSQVTYAWAEGYVRRLKLERNLVPSSIRKRVGSLARVLDWHFRTVTPPGQPAPATPLRLLPRGYSSYSRAGADAVTAKGMEPKRDTSRDRRLLPDEELRIRSALGGEKRRDRERALAPDPELAMLFDLVLHTGLRLREAYRLRVQQVDLLRHVIDVDGAARATGDRSSRARCP